MMEDNFRYRKIFSWIIFNRLLISCRMQHDTLRLFNVCSFNFQQIVFDDLFFICRYDRHTQSKL